MSSGNARTWTSTEIGTGASMDIKDVGFRPKTVEVRNGGVEAYWQEGMPDASMYKRLANGTGSLVTVNGITPLASGFTLGADADVNTASGKLRIAARD